MLNPLLIILGKIVSKTVKLLNLGDGSTWPGHIALSCNRHFIRDILYKSPCKIILIAGTNGKTTTASLIYTVLEKNGKKVIQNQSGANLLSGVASTLMLNTSNLGKFPYDYAIFEVDENILSLLLGELEPDYLILLNLFRDQLDRYGEINIIAKKWRSVIEKLPESTKVVLNADDPQIAFLGKNIQAKKLYFGLSESKTDQKPMQQSADSIYCPNCERKLTFKKIFFSHLGQWHCEACGLNRPKPDIETLHHYPLSGTYNIYNTLAAVLVLQQIGIKNIDHELKNFKPAFGRQEIIEYEGKKVQIFLSKNPTSFNQSYETIKDLHAHTLLLVLNDRIPDGRDISWIWDVDLPGLQSFKKILIAGDRGYDMALRIKYEEYKNFEVHESLSDAINTGLEATDKNETFFVLPTYSAMLDVRKILTGKKIL